MKRDKYMGMDVNQATTVVAVIDAEGKIVLETIVATAAAPIRRLIESISGPVHITFEETTQAEWLYELLQGFVAEVVVCDPRRNRLLSEGSKGDRGRCSEAGGVVADRYGSFGLARTANDAWVEGNGSVLRNLCGRRQANDAAD